MSFRNWTVERLEKEMKRNGSHVTFADRGEPSVLLELDPDAETGEKPAERFARLWDTFGGPELKEECSFARDRKWRIDFYEPITQTGIEIEGGTWAGGRHVRGQGYRDDCVKYNEATRMGIRLQRLTSDMVTGEYVRGLIAWVLGGV